MSIDLTMGRRRGKWGGGLGLACGLFLMILPLVVQAQRPPDNVRIHEWDGQGYQPCEPSMAINPRNPEEMIAGSILDNVYRSTNGGWTWDRARLESRYGVFGDPCVVASPSGDFYYLHLSDPEGEGWRSDGLLDRIVIQRSKNGGKSWHTGYGVGLNGLKDQDKEWAAVSPDGKQVAVCWTQFDRYGSDAETDSTNILCSVSTRKAKNWTNPVRVNKVPGDCLDGDNTVEGAVPAFGTEGELYVAWAHGESVWFDRSEDGGLTWLSEDRQAAAIVGGWEMDIDGIGRANGMPITAVDHSDGPTRGRIFVNWADARHGEEDIDIFVTWSDDRGETWSPAVRVNDDPAGAQQFFPWMAVDPVTGDVHVVFYDRRAAHADHPNPGDLRRRDTDVYLATSKDGGDTWSNMLISEESFRPGAKGVFFGDYNNVAAYDGVVRPIWTREERGILSVWTAIIEMQ
jgi:hypothetical protein